MWFTNHKAGPYFSMNNERKIGDKVAKAIPNGSAKMVSSDNTSSSKHNTNILKFFFIIRGQNKSYLETVKAIPEKIMQAINRKTLLIYSYQTAAGKVCRRSFVPLHKINDYSPPPLSTMPKALCPMMPTMSTTMSTVCHHTAHHVSLSFPHARICRIPNYQIFRGSYNRCEKLQFPETVLIQLPPPWEALCLLL